MKGKTKEGKQITTRESSKKIKCFDANLRFFMMSRVSLPIREWDWAK
jgi:hypothetical protein